MEQLIKLRDLCQQQLNTINEAIDRVLKEAALEESKNNFIELKFKCGQTVRIEGNKKNFKEQVINVDLEYTKRYRRYANLIFGKTEGKVYLSPRYETILSLYAIADTIKKSATNDAIIDVIDRNVKKIMEVFHKFEQAILSDDIHLIATNYKCIASCIEFHGLKPEDYLCELQAIELILKNKFDENLIKPFFTRIALDIRKMIK